MHKKTCILTLTGLLGLALLMGGCGASGGDGPPSKALAPPSFSGSDEGISTPAGETGGPSELAADPVAVEAKVYLNGNRLVLDNPAYLEQDEVMVPLAEALSYFSRSIEVQPGGQSFTVMDGDKDNTIVLTVGSTAATLNGGGYTFTLAPAAAGESDVYVEAACFAALFDAEVKYNDDKTAVYITESGLC